MAMDYNNSFISRYPIWNGGATLEIGGIRQPVRIIEVNREVHCGNLTPKTTITCTFAGDLNGLVKTALNSVYGLKSPIKNVIFNDPATIVYWTDGTKTIVKCNDGDTYSPERGLLMAIALAQRLADLQRMADESELSDAPGMSASYLDQASSVIWIARCLNIHYEVREEARKYYEFD